jgi:hypothetical protein
VILYPLKDGGKRYLVPYTPRSDSALKEAKVLLITVKPLRALYATRFRKEIRYLRIRYILRSSLVS